MSPRFDPQGMRRRLEGSAKNSPWLHATELLPHSNLLEAVPLTQAHGMGTVVANLEVPGSAEGHLRRE